MNNFRKLIAAIAIGMLITLTSSASTLGVLGDSIAAGMQSGTINQYTQVNSFAKLIADAGGFNYSMPLIDTSFNRLFPSQIVTNVAVPGHRVIDSLDARYGSFIPSASNQAVPNLQVMGLTGLFLFPQDPFDNRSQIEWIEAIHPNVLIVEIGGNDVLQSAIAGIDTFLTPVADFQNQYHELLLRAKTAVGPNGDIVTVNIVNLLDLPFFIPATTVSALTGIPLSVLGVGENDLILASALDPAKPFPALPLNGSLFLTQDEVSTISTAISNYNTIIKNESDLAGVPMFDLNARFSTLISKGYVIKGHRLSGGIGGGLFSLDLIHPSNTAHAVLGNDIIQLMNKSFNLGIPRINEINVFENDPYHDNTTGTPAASFTAAAHAKHLLIGN